MKTDARQLPRRRGDRPLGHRAFGALGHRHAQRVHARLLLSERRRRSRLRRAVLPGPAAGRARHERFYGLASADYQRDETGIGTATYIHRFSADTTRENRAAQGRLQRDLWAVAPRLPAGTTVDHRRHRDQSPAAAPRRRGAHADQPDRFHDHVHHRRHEAPACSPASSSCARKRQRWNWAGRRRESDDHGRQSRIRIRRCRRISSTARARGARQLPRRHRRHLRAGHGRAHAAVEAAARRALRPLQGRLRARRARRPAVAHRPRVELSHRPACTSRPTRSRTTSRTARRSIRRASCMRSTTAARTRRRRRTATSKLGAKWELLDGNLSLRTAVFRTEKTTSATPTSPSPSTEPAVGQAPHRWHRARSGGPHHAAVGSVRRRRAHEARRSTPPPAQQANTLGKKPINTPSYTSNLWTTYRWAAAGRSAAASKAVGKRYAQHDQHRRSCRTTRAGMRWSRTSEPLRDQAQHVQPRSTRTTTKACTRDTSCPASRARVLLTVELKF